MAEVDVVALIEHATTHELQQAVAQTKELQVCFRALFLFSSLP